MSATTPAGGAPQPTPHGFLAVACAVHSGTLAWAAVTLPWNPGTPLALAALGLASAHGVTAVLATVHARALPRVWRGLAVASLLYFAACAWQLLNAASYLASLYGGLGRGVAAAAAIALAPVALFTLPFGLWGLAQADRGAWPRRGAATASLLALGAALAVVGPWRAAAAARSQALPTPSDWIGELASAEPRRPRAAAPRPPPPAGLDFREPAGCERVPGARDGEATAVVRYRAAGTGDGTRVACLQADAATVAREIESRLAGADPDAPLKIDWIVGVRPLSRGPAWVRRLGVRPGQDGVCLDGRCLMPWQLVLADQFNSLTPLSFVPDFRFGVDTAALRNALGVAGDGGGADLRVIEVVSLVRARDGALVPLRRLRPPAPRATADALVAAARRIEEHIVRAQQDDGNFRYRVDPASGDSLGGGFSLARQAGTTLVLCELARDRERAATVARRSLTQLAGRERRHGELGGLVGLPQQTQAHLGRNALPLIAFLSCRELVGSEFDPLIARLGQLLLAAQRPDGSFAPRIDLATGTRMPGPAPLYADGQAIFALALLERDLAGQPGQPPRGVVRDAVERAMDRVAGAYWNHPLRDFFFLEENWHCLAARASLDHHRHDGYERFCLDYTAFRVRLQLDAESGADPDFAGGFGFSNLFPPHNVPSAGLGEIFAAAIAVAEARGEDTAVERRRLRRALAFLLRQQWSDTACFACARPSRVVGGFSESPGSPVLRIDYAQHAWAAIGHGAAALGDAHHGPGR